MRTAILRITMVLNFIFFAAFEGQCQVTSFPYSQGFENPFQQGTNVSFLPHWEGNEVRSSSRIFQSSNAHTGSFAMAITPTSTFEGIVEVTLDLTNRENTLVSFYAKSEPNGSATSTRPALVFFSTSTDGGFTFSDETQIGDDTTFPNSEGESYQQYSYPLNGASDLNNEVIVRIRVARGDGSGSAAQFLMDEVTISATAVVDNVPPTISSANASSSNQIQVSFSESVTKASAEQLSNYQIDNGVSLIEAIRSDSKPSQVLLEVSELTNGEVYELTLNGVSDLSGNVINADSKVSFQFIEAEEPEMGDVVINEFMSDPNPPVALPNAEFVELFNASDKFIQLQGWQLSDANDVSEDLSDYIIKPSEYVIICDEGNESLFASFGPVLEVDDFPDITISDNFLLLKNKLGQEIFRTSYSRSSQDGVTFELVNPFATCDFTYSASTSSQGGTPGSENSVFDNTTDTTAPIVSEIRYTDRLIITFSEPMDAASLVEESNYHLSGDLTITSIETTGDFPSQVELLLDQSLPLGVPYTIRLSDLSDCSGNGLQSTELTFGRARTPVFNELIITEILFDENPSVGLPEREYIEIYNASDFLLSTDAMQLLDATGTAPIPSFDLAPDSYAVLTSTAGAQEFTRAIGVPSFPSLSNSGEILSLVHEGSLIFSIRYQPSWHDDSRSEGGYALEMVDVTNPCLESGANWKSAIATRGGTPGAKNSVANPGAVPDNMPPILERAIPFSRDTLALVFNEKINPASILRLEIESTPALSSVSAFFAPNYPDRIFLKLSEKLVANQPVSLQVSQVSDCSGNESASSETVTFAWPVEAEVGQILLSEVLFNPRSGGVDFVELYNRSDDYISLQGWQIARIDDEGLDDQVIFTEEPRVLSPNDFLVLTPDPDILFNEYPKGALAKFLSVNPFPVYANDIGNVVLLNKLGQEMDKFSYQEEDHYSLLEDVDGVSLERISYDQPADALDNWRSASSVEGFATPGYFNSQMRRPDGFNGKMVVDPKVFIPGNIGMGRDFTTFRYQLKIPGSFANVTIYDRSGRLVKRLARGELLSTSGFFRWDGDTDSGQMARMGVYLVVFEIYKSSGASEMLKETVVVGRNF